MKDKLFKHNKKHHPFGLKKALLVISLVLLTGALVATPVVLSVYYQNQIAQKSA